MPTFQISPNSAFKRPPFRQECPSKQSIHSQKLGDSSVPEKNNLTVYEKCNIQIAHIQESLRLLGIKN